MIKIFLSWLNKRLRHSPSFQMLRQDLFESIAKSCRIRRNPKAIRALKVIPPIAQPSSSQKPFTSSRWSFIKAFFPKNKKEHTTRKTSSKRAFTPRKTGQASPLTDPNNIVYTLPRSEIIATLNQTLGQTPSQSPSQSPTHTNPHPHPIAHPELGQFSTSSRAPHDSEHGASRHTSGQHIGQGPALNNRDNSIEHLERSYADHPDTLEELSDLAYLNECQGRYAEAEQLYKQVLTLKQRRLGPDHIEIATSLSDLASLYCLQNRHEVALPLLQKTLTIRQQHLVAHHPNLGETLHQLAQVYRYQEQYGKAEPLFQQALVIFRQQLGPQHPRTQAVYDDLMHMIVTTIEGGSFSELASELPPLDLNTLSDTYSWAKPSWQQ